MKPLALLYSLFCLLLLALLAWQLPQGGRIQTDLAALLPAGAGMDAVQEAADAAQQRLLNGQIVLLAGAENPDTAFRLAEATAQRWRQSGLFSQVDAAITPDLAALRQSARTLGLATLPPEQVRQLYHAPEQYFQQRAEAAANPFSGSLLPLEDDWLGFGRYLPEKHSTGRLQWQPESGWLYTEHGGKTWVWLRAKLPDQQAAAGLPALLPLLADSREAAAAQGGELLAAGGALFAAEAKVKAERESSLMSAFGLTLTFALLWQVFRSGRILLLFLPLAAGLLSGLAAALAVFGQVHILTLVIGTSLVGVLVDFPLHWLTPSLFRRPWQPAQAMRHVLPTFLIGLAVTVSGYVLLWFTPLPVLRQTAVFSAAALLGAFAATVLWLPLLFGRYTPRPGAFARATHALAERLPGGRTVFSGSLKWPLMLLLPAVTAGIARSNWADDIRHWSAAPPALLADSRRVAELSGMGGSGQFVLIQADTPDRLLAADRALLAEWEKQGVFARGEAASVQALSQWLLPANEQQALKQRLRELAGLPESHAPLQALGVPAALIRQALLQAAGQPDISLEESLRGEGAEAWRSLYLGRVGHQYAAIMRLTGVQNPQALKAALDTDCTGKNICRRWADTRQQLNRQFQATRNQAAWLKLASFFLAWLVLWRLFGLQRGSLILAVPLAAAAAGVGLLGWLGIPISLFALFGLLLTAAIGVDYAVYALTAREPRAARIGGIVLAALTTGLSFALLAFSSTPAVAAFGLTVAAGCAFNCLAAILLSGQETPPPSGG